ncbi:hypothetical protein, partial [Mesomycoplasma hyorhinis]|uniref:hypothetical protein n=1 Tax=Mesomycoplasma hyorhinis TaxID=2100 RepID=UPI001C047924
MKNVKRTFIVYADSWFCPLYLFPTPRDKGEPPMALFPWKKKQTPYKTEIITEITKRFTHMINY